MSRLDSRPLPRREKDTEDDSRVYIDDTGKEFDGEFTLLNILIAVPVTTLVLFGVAR